MILQRWGGKILRRILTLDLQPRSRVLRNATVQIHSIATAPPLTKFAIPQDNFYFDITITPQASQSVNKFWEPRCLVLVTPDARAGDPEDPPADVGGTQSVQIWQGQDWIEDTAKKYEGSQRLKLLVGLKPGVKNIRFRYLLEVFGDVIL